MRNLIVTGAGRSGTSLVAGSLSAAGYHLGSQVIPAAEGNPKGYFEDREVNAINDALLAQVVRVRPTIRGARFLKKSLPRRPHLWLSSVPMNARFHVSDQLCARMRAVLRRKPFCLKDPRFAYTLAAWRRQLPTDTGFVVAFRHPAITVDSVLRSVDTSPYLRDYRLSRCKAYDIWLSTYNHILGSHSQTGEWLFLHYDDLLDGSGLKELERFAAAAGDYTFADRTLRRSVHEGVAPAECISVYERLCARARPPHEVVPHEEGGVDG